MNSIPQEQILQKPKKAVTAFFYYQKERRSDIKKDNPAAKNLDVINQMASEWRVMSTDAKLPFNKLAEADKERYKKEKLAFKKK